MRRVSALVLGLELLASACSGPDAANWSEFDEIEKYTNPAGCIP